METLKFELTLNESNQILKSLGDMPYVQVASLIQKIKLQAESQLHEHATLDSPKEEQVPKSHVNGKSKPVSEV